MLSEEPVSFDVTALLSLCGRLSALHRAAAVVVAAAAAVGGYFYFTKKKKDADDAAAAAKIAAAASSDIPKKSFVGYSVKRDSQYANMSGLSLGSIHL